MCIRKVFCLLVLIIMSLFFFGCNSPATPRPRSPSSTSPTPTPTSTPTCVPISGPVERKVTGESSSIKIPDKTFGYKDDPVTDFCDVSLASCWSTLVDLGIKKIDVEYYVTQYGCFTSTDVKKLTGCEYHALAALDVYPDNVCFPNVNPIPNLTFDLSVKANQPTCIEKDNCPGQLVIYQLIEPTPTPPISAWRFVGNATLISNTTLAVGEIDHLSSFVLVQLPTARPVSTGTFEMVVASSFKGLGNTSVRVALRILDSKQNDIKINKTLLFRFNFSNEPKAWPQNKNCKLVPRSSAEHLTCLFPAGTSVKITFQNSVVTIKSASYSVSFNATMEVY